MVPAYAAFSAHMDNLSLRQDVNMLEDASASDIGEQIN